jgi:flagellar motor switch protein FliN/FliY
MNDEIESRLADAAPTPALSPDLDRILEIPLEITVELGRRRMRIAELLEIDVGSVLELGTAAGTPLSIYANRVLVAQGEAVIVGERYGVRITDIVPASERVRRLGASEVL